jgi:hypothetical protein
MVVDYYALLGLDRHADRLAIEAALARCQAEWHARMSDDGAGGRIRAYLGSVPAIRRSLLGSTAARAAYDAELLSMHQSTRQHALDRLQHLVELRAAKGGLTVSDRQRLRVEAERWGLAREEVDRMASAFPPLPEPPHETESPIDPASLVETGEWDALTRRLDELGLQSLYEAIGLSNDADDDTITARLRERPGGSGSGRPEPDPVEVELRLLIEHHLGSAEARARHDRTAAWARERVLEETIALTLEGQQRLDPDTRAALDAESTRLGVSPERCETLVRRVCREVGVAIEIQRADVPGRVPSRTVRWLRCPRCRGLTDIEAVRSGEIAVCSACQTSLRWECPLCQRTHWIDEPRCACDFAREHVRPMVERFEAAQYAFRLRRFHEALEQLRQVQKYAPRHVGARKGIEKIQQQIGEIRRVRADYKQEKASRQWMAAQATIDRWARLVSPTDSRLKAAMEEASDALAAARAKAVRASQAAETDSAQARLLYRQALALATDLPEALNGLQQCPPNGPTRLVGHVAGRQIHLRWSPPEPDGEGACRYRVLRRRDAQPAHAEDGSVVAEVADLEWTDTDVVPGSVHGYAVFALRGAVRSIQGVAAGPFVAVEEVNRVHIDPDTQSLRLRWSLPAAAAGVRLIRKLGTPVKNLRDGLVVKSGRDGAIDRGLADRQLYHYAIYALFRGPGGRLHPSRGVSVAAVPDRPPEPVNDLRIVDDGAGQAPLTLGWTPATRGTVRLARLAHLPPWVPGERRRATELDGLGATWVDEVAPGRGIDRTPNAGRPCAYLPLVLHNGLATVGTPLPYARVPDPTHLHAYRPWNEPDSVVLTWHWPTEPAGARCLLVTRTGRQAAGPDDPEARAFEVTRADYERQGGSRLSLPARSDLPCFVSVYTRCDLEGRSWTSSGREPSARTPVPGPNSQVLVFYTVTPGSAGRSWSLSVRTEPPGSVIGPTVLVAQPRILPLTPREGLVVGRFAEARDGERLRFDPGTRLEGRRLRLFADPDARPGNWPVIRLCLPDEPR